MRNFFNILKTTITNILLILLLVVITFVFWLGAEKRKVSSNLVTQIEEVLESSTKDLKVFIGKADTEFISFTEGFSINIYESFFQVGDDIFINVPHAELRLKISDLLKAKIKFRELVFDKPRFEIKATKQDHKSVTTFAQESLFKIYSKIVYDAFSIIDKDKTTIPFETVELRDSIMSFNALGKYQNYSVKKATMSFYKLQNTTFLRTTIQTKIKDKQTNFNIDARLLTEDKIMLKFIFAELPYSFIPKQYSQSEMLSVLKPVLKDGDISIVLEKKGVASSLLLNSNLGFEGDVLGKSTAKLHSEIILNPDKDNNIFPEVKGQVRFDNLKAKKALKVWPDTFAPETKEIISDRYINAFLEYLGLNFDLTFSDLNFSKIKTEKFSVEGRVVDSTIKYYREFPELYNATGNFFYDGNNVYVSLETAKMEGVEFLPTNVNLWGLNEAETILEVAGNFEGDIAGIKPIMAAIFKGRDENYFYNTREITSNSKTSFYYKDNINNAFEKNVVQLDVKSDMENVIVKNALKNLDVSAKAAKMIITPDGLTVTGEVESDSKKGDLEAYAGFDSSNKLSIKYKGDLTIPNLAKQIPVVAEYAFGEVTGEINYEEEYGKNIFSANIDLTKSDINVPYISWDKNNGQYAQLNFNGRAKNNFANVEIPTFNIFTKTDTIKGNAIFSDKESIGDEIFIENFTTGINNAQLYYNKRKLSNSKSAYTIRINGDSYDAKQLFSIKNDSSKNNNYELRLEAQLNKLFLPNNVTYQNFLANINCDFNRCKTAKISAQNTDSEGGLNISYSSDAAGNRNLKADVNDVGKLFSAIDLFTSIEGGNLVAVGATLYNPDPKQEVLVGEFKISKYKLKEAPVLAKILSIASLTGISGLFSQDGIPMKRLEGNFKNKQNFLAIENVISVGNSMGYTTQGVLNTKTGEVDFSGSVTPSYSLNAIFTKIPLLGKIISGTEGEGIISTRYRIKGKKPKIDVDVNPFSALTPGVLRNLWGESEIDLDKRISGTPTSNKNKK